MAGATQKFLPNLLLKVEKASVKTTLYLMHDKDNLYVGFACLDQNPEKLISNSRYIPDGDAVSFVLDTFHDGLAAYAFGSNPKANQLTGNGYNIAMVIPLSSIPYDWQNKTSIMRFRAVRTTHQKQEFNYPGVRYDQSGGALLQYQTALLHK